MCLVITGGVARLLQGAFVMDHSSVILSQRG